MRNDAKSRAGRLGGRARVRLHGNPGTPEGRRLGGLRSLKTHRSRGTEFVTLKKVRKPTRSVEFAELMGILAGDGHLDTYQVSVTTNAVTDMEHAMHIRKLFSTVFAAQASLRKRSSRNAVIVLLSSKSACDFIEAEGMRRGNKVEKQIAPPAWIFSRHRFKCAFLRGLIDTDGTVYIDKHTINGKDYGSICIAFTNASMPLLDFVSATFEELGYRPTRWGRQVRLRRQKDVLAYAKTIGFSNPKHARKIRV